MARKKDLGRITFPGNPWPKGHAIAAFEWSARVERSSGIWFDLHLETAPYDADDKRRDDDDDDEDDDATSDWQSKVVWCNYHSCTLSSTNWIGNCFGFLAGSASEPLDFNRISKRAFAFDDSPEHLQPPRPFHIYLTGHDAVSGHRITFRKEPKKRTYAIAWSGKIALAYGGSDTFEHEFHAKIKGARFGGIVFPSNTSTSDAIDLTMPFVENHRAYTARRGKNAVRLMPK